MVESRIGQGDSNQPLLIKAAEKTTGFYFLSEAEMSATVALGLAGLNFVRDPNDLNREGFLDTLAQVGYSSEQRVAIGFILNLLAEDRKRVLEEQAYITRTREGVEQS